MESHGSILKVPLFLIRAFWGKFLNLSFCAFPTSAYHGEEGDGHHGQRHQALVGGELQGVAQVELGVVSTFSSWFNF